MNERHLVFLNILKTELSRTLIPKLSDDISHRIAALAAEQLQRLLLDETVVPKMRAEAVAAYQTLLPALSPHIEKSLHATLQQSLSSASAEQAAALDAALRDVTAALLGSKRDGASKLVGQLVAIDARFRSGKETAFADRHKNPAPVEDDSAGASSGSGLDDAQQARLLDFLREKFPAEKNLRIASVKPVPGGFSKQTIFINLENNVELPASLVMRCDAAYETAGGSVTMEFPTIQKMYAGGVAVPRPWAIDDAGKVLGRKFILVARAPGINLGNFLVVTHPSREAALDLAAKLAKMHTAPIDGLESVLEGGTMPASERLMGEIRFHEDMWAAVTNTKAWCIDAAFKWLKDNIALADGPRSLVHRDVGVHNMLFDDNKVSAFLDWETAVIGNPAEDVAYTYYNVAQMIDWDDYLAAYQKAAGVTLDQRQLDYYMLWGSLRVVVGISRMTDPVFSGKRINLPEYYLADYFGQTLFQRVSTKLGEVLR